jgi:carbonic anhydrase/acetyltransferase-like protein (isoleucine patch superfamily)
MLKADKMTDWGSKMIRSFDGKSPKIAESAWVSEAAYVVGDVEIGPNSAVWPGAVVRADFTKIIIGGNTDIEDNCVIHGMPGEPMEIGDNVVITHGAVVHSRSIGSHVFIGINAAILPHAEVGNQCFIAANSVVTEGMKIPDGSFVAGVPARVKGKISEKQLSWIKSHLEVYPQMAKRHKEQGL